SFNRSKFNNPIMSDNDGYDLFLWFRFVDRGELFHNAIAIKMALEDYFDIQKVISSYTSRGKYDLSGFDDGIETPTGLDV
ncbi:peroxidase, partial [Francisella tularensis subsp. holarctica]|nr:peroxidase [Francisella tularensis subsp. holarctica]